VDKTTDGDIWKKHVNFLANVMQMHLRFSCPRQVSMGFGKIQRDLANSHRYLQWYSKELRRIIDEMANSC
jgi:hypothetical protein